MPSRYAKKVPSRTAIVRPHWFPEIDVENTGETGTPCEKVF